MKERSNDEWREWEKEAKEFIKANYPFKQTWVAVNLGVLNNTWNRKDPISSRMVARDAIQITEDFALQNGINLYQETDVLHIPSRLEAIRKFERDIVPLCRELSLDKTIRILIVAEAVSVQKSVDCHRSDVMQNHMNKLTELVRIHKDLNGGI